MQTQHFIYKGCFSPPKILLYLELEVVSACLKCVMAQIVSFNMAGLGGAPQIGFHMAGQGHAPNLGISTAGLGGAHKLVSAFWSWDVPPRSVLSWLDQKCVYLGMDRRCSAPKGDLLKLFGKNCVKMTRVRVCLKH
jgi:hypothetical protein